MTSLRCRTVWLVVSMFVLFLALLPAQVVLAQDDPWTGKPPDNILPLPPLRARTKPAPIPVPLKKMGSNTRQPSIEAAAANPKPAKNQAIVVAKNGDACLNFDGKENWGSQNHSYKPWDDQFAGWAPFAVDDGGLYEIENVRFEREQSVKTGQYSFKIASTEPYAAGLASPLINVNKGDEVAVSVKYYIWEHGQSPLEWVSMGVKPDARAKCGDGCYVNGDRRGKWTELSNTVEATADQMMILLQAESPKGLNSNVYFDDLEIRVNGELLEKCKLADE